MDKLEIVMAAGRVRSTIAAGFNTADYYMASLFGLH
jgi:hypothetical protein